MILPIFKLEEEKLSHAFNLGSDARLAGKDLSFNPYYKTDDVDMHKHWRLGWMDVDSYYAKNVRGRWKFNSLVPMSRQEGPDHVLATDLVSSRFLLGGARPEDERGDGQT